MDAIEFRCLRVGDKVISMVGEVYEIVAASDDEHFFFYRGFRPNDRDWSWIVSPGQWNVVTSKIKRFEMRLID